MDLNRQTKEYRQIKTYLTSLDQVIGDSDHGINMARGFQEVEIGNDASNNYSRVSDVLKDMSMTYDRKSEVLRAHYMAQHF